MALGHLNSYVSPVVHGYWYDITTYNCGERVVATCSHCKDRGELKTENRIWCMENELAVLSPLWS